MADIPKHYRRRLAKLRSAMADAGATLYLADHGELMAWLTGYTVSETMYRAVLVPAEGDPWIVLRALDAPQVAVQGWLRDVVGFDDWEDPFAKVAGSVAERGFAAARILTDSASYSFTAHALSRLTAELPNARFEFRPGLSDTLRAVKDEPEIEALRKASGIADRSMEKVRAEIGPGSTTRQAGALAAAGYFTFGADGGPLGRICRGHGSTGFLHAEVDDTPLRDGDVLHAELVPRVKGYSARLMRPIAIGSVGAELEDVTASLITLQDRQIEAMAAGRIVADVDAILRHGLVADGLRDRVENVTGYMLGLYGRTPRASDFSHVFLPTSRWPLEAGMVFHMYTSAAGIGISETVLVTDQGGERLTQTPRRLLVCGG